MRNDSAIAANTNHAKSHLVNDGTTNYEISIGAQSMTGQVGSEFGYAHMYKNLMNCFPSPYPLATENHHTTEHSTGTEDETYFHDYRFLMGSNLESSMENKLPTISGNRNLEHGGDVILKITRTGTTDYNLIALVEYTQILKVDNRHQVTLLN